MKKRMYRTFYTGAIRPIYELFVKPVAAALAYKEDESSLGIGISRFFHVDTRSVHFARATGSFELRGEKWIKAQSPHFTEGFSIVRVEPGDQMYVRIDTKMPNRIDIEIGRDVYTVTAAQWQVIKDRVQFVG